MLSWDFVHHSASRLPQFPDAQSLQNAVIFGFQWCSYFCVCRSNCSVHHWWDLEGKDVSMHSWTRLSEAKGFITSITRNRVSWFAWEKTKLPLFSLCERVVKICKCLWLSVYESTKSYQIETAASCQVLTWGAGHGHVFPEQRATGLTQEVPKTCTRDSGHRGWDQEASNS